LFSKGNTPKNIELKIKGKKIEIQDSVKFLGVILDQRLNWKSHIEYVSNKCKRRLNLLRAVSGYKWGANKKSLLMLYRALIRPVIDYGAVAFCTAADTNLKILERIQSQALRLCCGASRGTATLALQNECGEMPLRTRWLELSIKEGTKISTTKNHPAEQAMMDHWTLHTNKFKTDKEPLYNRTAEFNNTHTHKCRGPTFQETPPWKNKRIQTDTTLTKTINKKTVNPEIQKLLTLSKIDEYNDSIRIYTDGSKFEDTTSAAVIVPEAGVRKVFRIADSSSVYAAELTAIKEAINWINTQPMHNNNKFTIFTDSLSSAQTIKSQRGTSRPTLMIELNEAINRLETRDVTVVWIPGHVGVRGNEEADAAAKEGLNLRNVNSTDYIEYSEMYSVIRKYSLQKWQKTYDDSTEGSFFKKIEPTVSTKVKYADTPRGREVQITRLRLGRVITNDRLMTMKRHADGTCDRCKTPDSIQHLLLECTRKNISTRLKENSRSLGLEHNIKNILTDRNMQHFVANIICDITGGKIL